MTKDYRSKSPDSPRRRNTRNCSCVYWFLIGGVFGAFGVGYAWMTHEPEGSDRLDEIASTRPPNEPVQERTFDFYSLLPEEEVVVPANDQPTSSAPPTPQPATPSRPTPQPATEPTVSAPEPAPPRQPEPAIPQPATPQPATPAPAPQGDWVLQLGSFRGAEDAQRLKAQLALQGIQTRIQTVTINDGQTYHRVRTGAYDKAEAQAMRNAFKRQGQDSVMMRAR